MENIFKYFNPSYFPQIPYAILLFILFYTYSKTSQDAIIILNEHYSFIIFLFIYSDIYPFCALQSSIFPFFHLGLFSYCMRNSLFIYLLVQFHTFQTPTYFYQKMCSSSFKNEFLHKCNVPLFLENVFTE